jgi:Glyoxalase/Bleomycin resistance protein/Dioxygenase superfamily
MESKPANQSEAMAQNTLQRQNHPSHVASLLAYDHRPGTLCDWYYKVLGVSPVHETARPLGEVTLSGLRALWLTNDRANHRIRILYVPGLEGDLERACHHRLQHFAFEYSILDNLLSTDARLKSLKIEPLRTANQGATIYLDPDGNCIELLSDAEGDRFTQTHVEWESRNHNSQ